MLVEGKYSVDEKQEKKINDFSGIVFDLLASNLHSFSNGHSYFVKRAISNSLYDGPKIKSGMISVVAKEKLLNKEIERKKLCYEHPYPRTRTAVDIMNTFDLKFGKVSNTELKEDIKSSIINGSKVHLVLTEENQRLYPFQQDYTLTEEQIYNKAGVVLTQDELLSYFPYTYTYNDIEYNSQPQMAEALGLSEYRIEKMVKNGEISKRKNN
jgi:hypothetical protein